MAQDNPSLSEGISRADYVDKYPCSQTVLRHEHEIQNGKLAVIILAIVEKKEILRSSYTARTDLLELRTHPEDRVSGAPNVRVVRL